MCPSNLQCISIIYLCDGYSHCPQSEDERNCSIDFFQCFDNRSKISIRHVCNFIEDCPDGSDEMFCGMLNDFVWKTKVLINCFTVSALKTVTERPESCSSRLKKCYILK